VIKVEVMLHATAEMVSVEGLRAYHKGKDAAELLNVLRRSASIRLGTTYVVEPGNEEHLGPVGRLDAVLSLYGTRTWPPASLPRLDDELERELLAAFEPETDDPAFDVTPVPVLAAFLHEHREAGLATWSTPIE
jgi:hypothetical protein